MTGFNGKRVSDPVHKTIGLSELEARIISTQAFQRLRNVKQLGLANYVFPGADYSRLAHSLGVCHVTGRILDAIAQAGSEVTDQERQLYRLAGLLHDVGHYPYSHATEEAIEDHYSAGLLEGEDTSNDDGEDFTDQELFFRHEPVGKEVLTQDTELKEILDSAGIAPQDIYSTFMREEPFLAVANLISSDLDADRIDYLLRTAHHTGLPYGAIDIDYLLSQMRVDENNKVCVTAKALRTADHFLLSRYFDYQQVPFHKTVAALELVLKDVLMELLQQGLVDFSASFVSKTIAEGSWREFDDSFVLEKIREMRMGALGGSVQHIKAEAILNRRPPKLVASAERLGPRNQAALFTAWKSIIESKIPDWAERFGIDKSLWYVWPEHPGMMLTKVGPHVPVSALIAQDGGIEDEYDQSIRVLGKDQGSEVIMELDHSLMSILAGYALYSLRLYVLLPEGEEGRREELSRIVKEDTSQIEWN